MAAQGDPLTERLPSDGPPLCYRAFVPGDTVRRPALVAVHGGARAARRQFRSLMPTAIAHNVPLIVPTFGQERFRSYQTLAGLDGPLAAHRAFTAMLDDASAHLDIDTSRVDMLGFSGGAQFVHRYAMISPTRVRRLVVVSAGWYTFLDPACPFPKGCAAGAASGGLAADVAGFLRLPVHVLVGERDTRRDAALRKGSVIDAHQGNNRLARALRWVDHVEDAARAVGLPPRISFDLLPGTGHAFSEAVRHGGLADRVLTFLHPRAPAAVGEVVPRQGREVP